jgi:hypothetical protein
MQEATGSPAGAPPAYLGGAASRRGASISGWGARIARRRRRVTGADLHRLAGIAYDVARTIVGRLGRPIAAGRVNRLRIALVDNIARRP